MSGRDQGSTRHCARAKALVSRASRRYPGSVSSFVLNITFDCADPKAQAAFWAAVTGYPATDESGPGNPFWLVAWPRDEDTPRLAFVPSGEQKIGKNRVHV